MVPHSKSSLTKDTTKHSDRSNSQGASKSSPIFIQKVVGPTPSTSKQPAVEEQSISVSEDEPPSETESVDSPPDLTANTNAENNVILFREHGVALIPPSDNYGMYLETLFSIKKRYEKEVLSTSLRLLEKAMFQKPAPSRKFGNPYLIDYADVNMPTQEEALAIIREERKRPRSPTHGQRKRMRPESRKRDDCEDGRRRSTGVREEVTIKKESPPRRESIFNQTRKIDTPGPSRMTQVTSAERTDPKKTPGSRPDDPNIRGVNIGNKPPRLHFN